MKFRSVQWPEPASCREPSPCPWSQAARPSRLCPRCWRRSWWAESPDHSAWHHDERRVGRTLCSYNHQSAPGRPPWLLTFAAVSWCQHNLQQQRCSVLIVRMPCISSQPPSLCLLTLVSLAVTADTTGTKWLQYIQHTYNTPHNRTTDRKASNLLWQYVVSVQYFKSSSLCLVTKN